MLKRLMKSTKSNRKRLKLGFLDLTKGSPDDSISYKRVKTNCSKQCQGKLCLDSFLYIIFRGPNYFIQLLRYPVESMLFLCFFFAINNAASMLCRNATSSTCFSLLTCMGCVAIRIRSLLGFLVSLHVTFPGSALGFSFSL
ncbi:hypothetical protein Hanom_Chr07g00631151 [Helianthus anomalus]